MKKLLFILLAIVFASLALAQTEIRWYVGLGAGTDQALIDAQNEFVDRYNSSQSDVNLILEIVDNAQAYDVLATQIAAGNPPDIVGPMGIRGRDAFPGAWLDMAPLIAANNYDLSDFDPALIDFTLLKAKVSLVFLLLSFLLTLAITKTCLMKLDLLTLQPLMVNLI